MKYYINPKCLAGAFLLPTPVADKLKFCKAEHLKVILHIFRNSTVEIDPAVIGKDTGVSEYDVAEGLLYWEQCGVLKSLEPRSEKSGSPAGEAPRAAANLKPSRADVAKRGLEDPKIRHLLNEAQLKFGRSLKTNEASTLVWLYDDNGLDVSLILLILHTLSEQGRCNIRAVETTALDWIARGITTLSQADEEIRLAAVRDKAWRLVCSVFGLESRQPSRKESETAALWVEEWKLSPELIRAAYDACVDAKSKFSFAYTAKILESWHAKGYTSPADIPKKKAQAAEKSGNTAAYDLDLFEKMLNAK